MTSKLIAYRIQMMVLSLSLALFIIQAEPIMHDRGISKSVALDVIAITQILNIFTTLFWGHIIHRSERGYWIIRIGIFARMLVLGFLCLHVGNALFVAGVLLYNTVAGSVDIANEAQMMKWTADTGNNFGRIRLFASFGWSISGLLASALVAITGKMDSIIWLALICNAIFMALSLYRPNKIAAVQPHKAKAVKLDISIIVLILLFGIAMALPNTFGAILNSHFRDQLEVSKQQALFYAGLSVLFSAGVSEVTAFFMVDRVIRKIGAKQALMLSLFICVVRWVLATVIRTPMGITLTFLFHGFTFAFGYTAFTTMVRQRLGNDSIGKTLTMYSVLGGVLGAIFTQIFKFILKYSTSYAILAMFIGISVVICVIFYIGYWKNPKYAGTAVATES